MIFRLLVLSTALVSAFGQPSFAISSVKTSPQIAGGDENNQFAYEAAGIHGTNVTLRRLLAEAYGLQLSQVVGPKWLDENEYDIQAIAGGPAPPAQLALMLRTLLEGRFKVRLHRGSEERRVYELTVRKGGPKIRPGVAPAATGGFPFHGNMQRFADLIAVQLSIVPGNDPSRPSVASGPPVPVLDRTGLAGIFDFRIDIRAEPGTDIFTLWQRTLQEKMGLKLESVRRAVEILVVGGAERVPAPN